MAKKVLITGGTKGIGLVAAKRFLDNGYEVAIVGRDFSNFHEERIRTFSFDLAKVSEIKTLAEKIGDVDILVNNAGIDRQKPYDNYPEEDIHKIVNVNLRAPIEFINSYAPYWKKEKSGRVINIASQAGEVGHPDIWYGITKAGLINATKTYAAILGPQGVVLNAIAPGPVKTEMIENSEYSERFETVRQRTYLQRVAKPEEIAEVIYWLATSAPEYINGEVIDLNNGAQKIK